MSRQEKNLLKRIYSLSLIDPNYINSVYELVKEDAIYLRAKAVNFVINFF